MRTMMPNGALAAARHRRKSATGSPLPHPIIVWTVSALLVSAGPATAQVETIEPFDLSGLIVDARTGQPLVGAFVGLAGSDWGSITEENGRFLIPDTDPGPLALTIEQLGYDTLTWAGNVSADDEPLVLRVEPRPVMLEGLRIVQDRFESRRRAVAVTVRAFDRQDLAMSPYTTALDHVRFRLGAGMPISCMGRRGDLCLRLRGRLVEPVVYVDEHPVAGGLSYLNSLAPHELQMLEVYGRGTHIRAYTPRFMERAARIRLVPIPIF